MGDFSQIQFDPDFPLIPKEFRSVMTWQSKDMPMDEGELYTWGKIRADGLFIRDFNRARSDQKTGDCWNPNLNGWIRFYADYGPAIEFLGRFENGKMVEVRGAREDEYVGGIFDTNGLPSATRSPDKWMRLEEK